LQLHHRSFNCYIPRMTRTVMIALVVLSCTVESTQHVLFICEHGAAKSVLAAAQFNRMAAERGLPIRAIARGAYPQPTPSEATADGLRADGLPPPTGSPAPVTLGDVRDAKNVIVFDCDRPAMQALRSLGTCWDDVPEIGDGYAPARDRIRTRLSSLSF
jgi:hypothetical protein